MSYSAPLRGASLGRDAPLLTHAQWQELARWVEVPDCDNPTCPGCPRCTGPPAAGDNADTFPVDLAELGTILRAASARPEDYDEPPAPTLAMDGLCLEARVAGMEDRETLGWGLRHPADAYPREPGRRAVVADRDVIEKARPTPPPCNLCDGAGSYPPAAISPRTGAWLVEGGWDCPACGGTGTEGGAVCQHYPEG